MNQPWKVVLAFVSVFVAGLVCGGPLLNWAKERLQENRPAFAERTMRRFEKDLELTEAQKERIAPILQRSQTDWRRFRQENMRNLIGVIDRMHVEIAAELNPEQRGRLEEISNEFRKRAERFRGRVRDQERAPADVK
jgi:hypothetical protein